jgi:hypothetical protein
MIFIIIPGAFLAAYIALEIITYIKNKTNNDI